MQRTIASVLSLATGLAVASIIDQPTTQPLRPEVGQTAMNFTLKTVEGESTSLYGLTADHNVVLVTLRGWPGYQCPICTKQVQELIANAKQFKDENGHVLLVYPGPGNELEQHAQEFLKETTLPENFTFVIDPDYTFTNLYHLRWDAPKETAYPSTFVVDQTNNIRYAKISTTHGDRAPLEQVLNAVRAIE